MDTGEGIIRKLDKERKAVKALFLSGSAFIVAVVAAYAVFIYRAISDKSGDDEFLLTSCVCFLMIIIFAWMVKKVQDRYKKYTWEYFDIALVREGQDDWGFTFEKKENSFLYLDKIAKMGIVPAGDENELDNYFAGTYRNISFEGGYAEIGRMQRRYANRRSYHYKQIIYKGRVGELKGIDYDGAPIVIYSRRFRKKRWPFVFEKDAEVRTANKQFNRKYVVKCIEREKALEFLSEDIMEAVIQIEKLNRAPIGMEIWGKKLVYVVKNSDMGIRAPILRRLDDDREFAEIHEKLKIYFRFMDVL